MKKIEKQKLYRALLFIGDPVTFSVTEGCPIHTGVFNGYTDRGNFDLSNVDGSERSMYPGNPVFYEDDRKGADQVAELLRTRSKEVMPSYVGFVRGAQAISDASEHKGPFQDADTVLADLHKNVDTEVSGVAVEILDIWEKSTDKDSVEKLFETIFGVSFLEYLVKTTEQMVR